MLNHFSIYIGLAEGEWVGLAQVAEKGKTCIRPVKKGLADLLGL